MGLFDSFFNEPPRAEKVSTLSKTQKKFQGPLYDALLSELGQAGLYSLISSIGAGEFSKDFMTPLSPELQRLQTAAGGLSLEGPLDTSTIRWMEETMGWTPSIDPAVAQEAITRQMEIPGYRALETNFLPAMNDLLAMQGGVGSSRRASLYGDALLDFGQQVAGERAQTSREMLLANVQADISARQLKSSLAPFAMSIPDLRASRIASQMQLQFPFQQRAENALTLAVNAYQQPKPGVQSGLAFMNTPMTSTNWWQPMSDWEKLQSVVGFSTGVGAAAGAGGMGPFAV